MEPDEIDRTRWTELPIRCPHCGNHGEEDGGWRNYEPVPFRLVEDVIRSFCFSATVDQKGGVLLLAAVETDDVDWESGTGLRLKCMQCYGDFPVPESFSVDFD